MINAISFDRSNGWEQQAQKLWMDGSYAKAASLYEQAIEVEAHIQSHYWNLGLLFLLQGQEQEAQATWLLGMAEATPQQIDDWTIELVERLQTEAHRQLEVANLSMARLVRLHVREIQPENINNILHLIDLCIRLNQFTGVELYEWEVLETLKSVNPSDINLDLLLHGIKALLDFDPLHPLIWPLVQTSLTYIQSPRDWYYPLLTSAVKIAYAYSQPTLAANLAELYLEVDPQHVECLSHLVCFYKSSGKYELGIEAAKRGYLLSQDLIDKVYLNYLLLNNLLLSGGYWDEVYSAIETQRSLLLSLFESPPENLSKIQTNRLFLTCFSAPYLKDNPPLWKSLQNRLSEICQKNIHNYYPEELKKYKAQNLARKKFNINTPPRTPIKIGFISQCLGKHSVGWMSRGFFEHYDREKFEVYIYFANFQKTADPLQEWFTRQASHFYFSANGAEIAEQIYTDNIDILVDLDSLTMEITCEVMALKPAPIQVTWLGWDACGLPAIDYFFADPYVLPDSAQDYYTEKIWRLPQTYIAVDGFEVDVPNIRREDLGIPSDAVVYYSGQTGYKRHPDTARLQIKIIKEVPNSYFLIKGLADEELIKNFFIQLAEEEGVHQDRLRFLPLSASEELHRANLGIMDIVLDTYPYNGATTTMETLWMGIPIVTRVGNQFAARNSYTMMINAGITEGIAWTDEEYIEWGVRLGTDLRLRQEISWKLRQSRQRSPLWNAQQLTREMEKAYQEMWQIYCQS